MYLENNAHIEAYSRIQVGVLLFEKALIALPVKYSNYNNIISLEYVAKLLEYNKINNYAIKLEKFKWPLFSQIYSLRLIELEILKTYIETNLTNSFI